MASINSSSQNVLSLFTLLFLSLLFAEHPFEHLLTNLETLPSLEPKVSFLSLPFTSVSFFEFLPTVLGFEMGFAFLLDTPASLATFRKKFEIPNDVEVAYCHESEIALHRGHGTAFFPLMAILEGGFRFSVDPFLVSTLRYYRLCPDQLPSNFYRVVSCVSRLNHTFDLQLDHHDINHMYSLCGNKNTNYYLKTRDTRVRLISCLLNSNRNSAEEFVRVYRNWFAEEIPCLLSRREVGSYQFLTQPFFYLW